MIKLGVVNLEGIQQLNVPIHSNKKLGQDFQMVLGSLMMNVKELAPDVQFEGNGEVLPELLERLIPEQNFSLNDDTNNISFDENVNSVIKELFPEWGNLFEPIVQWLKQQLPSENEFVLEIEEALGQGDCLSSFSQMIFVISEFNKETLKTVPVNELTSLINHWKSVSSKPIQMTLSELQKVEQIDESLERLLQVLNKETKYKNVQNIFEETLTKKQKGDEKLELPMRQPIFIQGERSGGEVNRLGQTIITDLDINPNPSPVANIESFTLKLTEPLTYESQVRDLIKQFSNILAKSHLSKGLNETKLFIRLYPEELGSLRVELTQKDSLLVARIIASTSKAKEMLESQLHQLKHAFTQQNLSLDRIEITISQNDPLKYTNQERGNSEEHKRDQDDGKDLNSNENERDFQEALNQFLFETEV